jgi:hypothetical protein
MYLKSKYFLILRTGDSTIERVEKNVDYLKVQLEEDFHNALETPNED